MIDIDGLTMSILDGLKVHTRVNEVIFADQEGPKPKGLYITIKVITPYVDDGLEIVEIKVIPSQSPNFEKDVEYSYTSFPRMTLSINIYGDDTFATAQRALEWFKYRKLSESTLNRFKAIAKEITGIQNRDTIIGGLNYERKQGFDVIIEIDDIVKMIENTIEIVKPQKI